ncbi:hypothetical protein CRUP_012051 [Coryphaenoides rupestris]|nr:hypothetical protein CRUP_012051 [Coryphaenoides rupestris]
MERLRRWKAGWEYPTTLLCVYGFFSTVKPLEPFLIPVNLFVTTAFLLWMRSVAAMQAVEFFFGVVTATEVAYFSYIYSVVDADKYRKATSYCRSVQLLGYTVGAVLGQLLVSLDLLSYHGILVLTLVLISIGTVPACFLPMPRRSMFFHRQRGPGPGPGPTPKGSMDNTREAGTGELTAREKVGEGGGEDDEGSSVRPAGCGQVIRQLWADFLQCYSSRQMLYWSVWWALATAGYNQTVNYVQLSLGAASGLEAAALFIMTFTGNIWVCYGGYVVFKGLYMLLITIAMYVCA